MKKYAPHLSITLHLPRSWTLHNNLSVVNVRPTHTYSEVLWFLFSLRLNNFFFLSLLMLDLSVGAIEFISTRFEPQHELRYVCTVCSVLDECLMACSCVNSPFTLLPATLPPSLSHLCRAILVCHRHEPLSIQPGYWTWCCSSQTSSATVFTPLNNIHIECARNIWQEHFRIY